MKYNIYTIITIFSLFILTSCSKNDIDVETNNSETNGSSIGDKQASDTIATSNLNENKQIIIDLDNLDK